MDETLPVRDQCYDPVTPTYTINMFVIMLGDGKAAFGRRRSADAANREAYEEYSRHYCSGDGGHASGRSRT